MGILIGALCALGCDEEPVTTQLPGTPGSTGGTTGGGTEGGTTGVQDVGQPSDTGGNKDTTSPANDTKQTDEQFCPPDYSFCNANTLFTCNADGTAYDTQVCQDGCTNGSCKTDCTNGQKKCLSTNLLGTCQADGTYQTQKCNQGLCKDGKCTTEQSLCENNELFCDPNGNKLLKCSADGQSAKSFMNCQYGCDAENKVCKEPVCSKDEARCAPDAPNWIETCKADQSGWQKVQGCDFECDGGKCVNADCQPNEKKCGNNALLACADDQKSFVVEESCQWGCGTATNGEPSCKLCPVGAKSCGNTPDTAWMTTSCDDPWVGWENDVACPFPDTCAAGDCISSIILEDNEDQLVVYATLLKAFLECTYQGADGVCAGINTQALDYDITDDNLQDAFCDKSETASYFDSSEQWAEATDLMGCTELFDIDDLKIKTGAVHMNLDGVECYAFSAGGGLFSNNKEIIVDNCWNFLKQAGFDGQ